jgi:hypothetical protein
MKILHRRKWHALIHVFKMPLCLQCAGVTSGQELKQRNKLEGFAAFQWNKLMAWTTWRHQRWKDTESERLHRVLNLEEREARFLFLMKRGSKNMGENEMWYRL